MSGHDMMKSVRRLLSEVVDGTRPGGGNFVLNSGDVGLLRSLDALSASDASVSANDGATIAAHAQHVRYGLSLMNRWLSDGSNPFADATWDEAWLISTVDDAEWAEIRAGLADEAKRWHAALELPRDLASAELRGVISSVVHVAYHLGAIRQIHKATRGPKEGTF